VSNVRINRWLVNGIGLVSTAAAGLIIWILVPVDWTTLRIAEIGALLLMYLSMWIVPQWLLPRRDNDAGALGFIGPGSVLATVYLGLGAAAFALSLANHPELSEAALVGAGGVWIGGILLLRLSSHMIQELAESGNASLEGQHLVATLSQIVPALSDRSLRVRIEQLVDAVRYGPTPTPASAPLAATIVSLAADVQNKATASHADTLFVIARLEDAVQERKSLLIQSRSRI
jgi:hypothetical protein